MNSLYLCCGLIWMVLSAAAQTGTTKFRCGFEEGVCGMWWGQGAAWRRVPSATPLAAPRPLMAGRGDYFLLATTARASTQYSVLVAQRALPTGGETHVTFMFAIWGATELWLQRHLPNKQYITMWVRSGGDGTWQNADVMLYVDQGDKVAFTAIRGSSSAASYVALDEVQITSVTSPQAACPDGRVRCGTSARCVLRHLWCNGYRDCSGSEDERQGCEPLRPISPTTTTTSTTTTTTTTAPPPTTITTAPPPTTITTAPPPTTITTLPIRSTQHPPASSSSTVLSASRTSPVSQSATSQPQPSSPVPTQSPPTLSTTNPPIFPPIATSPSISTSLGPGECSRGQLLCPTEDRCIPEEWWCDNIPDCRFQADEQQCPTTASTTRITRTGSTTPRTTPRWPTTPPKPRCGVRWFPTTSAAISTYIIGGSRVLRQGRWPWAVAIVKADTGIFSCGGVLLSNQWVMTAAHCVAQESAEPGMYKANSIYKFKVYLGSVDLKTPLVIRYISKIVIHPDYKLLYNDNTGVLRDIAHDVGLVRLAEPVADSAVISAICRPDPGMSFPREGCYTVGWGYTRMTNTRKFEATDWLHEAYVYIRDPVHCYADKKTRICVDRNSSDKDLGCYGDSGSPVMCPGPRGDWVLAGINSVGSPLCQGNDVFSNVTAYLPWIEARVGVA